MFASGFLLMSGDMKVTPIRLKPEMKKLAGVVEAVEVVEVAEVREVVEWRKLLM